MTNHLEWNGLQNVQQTRQQMVHKKNSDVAFDTILTNAVAPTQENVEAGFKEIWQARFPNAYCHVIDASKIPQEHWQRNDYPFEKFFAPNIDDSVLSWQPSGIEPQMGDASVQVRMESSLGQNAVLVPKELDE